MACNIVLNKGLDIQYYSTTCSTTVHVQVSLSRLGANNTQVFVLVENAMVDGAATPELQAPSLASSSGLTLANNTTAGSVVPATTASD